jgi:hypothetical protein
MGRAISGHKKALEIKMKLDETFDFVAQTMRADFEKARCALTHPGQKGDAFEDVFRGFLREYLPKSLDISTGTLVDTSGAYSRQLDIIISDAAKTPILFKSGEIRVIPVECAYAVIEVKARLDAKEINRIFENMYSVRRLSKKAYFSEQTWFDHYGGHWEILPINYFVFAFDSPDLRELGTLINARHQAEQLQPWSRIDTVCVLDKGLITNRHHDGLLDALPYPDTHMDVVLTKRSVLLFYALVMNYLGSVNMPRFVFTDYIKGIRF